MKLLCNHNQIEVATASGFAEKPSYSNIDSPACFLRPGNAIAILKVLQKGPGVPYRKVYHFLDKDFMLNPNHLARLIMLSSD